MTGRSSGGQGIGSWIDERARVAPGRVALIYGDTHRSYGELAWRVRRLANGLRSLGVTRGDRVGWLGPNHPAFLESLFATARIGAVLAPINHRLEPDVIDAICAEVAPRVVLLAPSLLDLRGSPALAAAAVVVHSDASDGQYERLIATAADEPVDEAVSLDDLCLLPFTSGTTGMPKGIRLSHGNLIWNVINCLSSLHVGTDEVTIAAAPFFRTGGTGVTVLPVLFRGGTVVIPRRTTADDVLHLVERYRATIAFGNPDLLEAITHLPRWSTADLASLRTVVTGGAPVPERLLWTCVERGIHVLQGYGLSEAAPLVSVLDAPSAPSKIGSAGRPVQFVDIRIARDDETDAAVGEIGELRVRGPNVMRGYWKRPDATRRAFDLRGWLRTGDAARLDHDGFLFIIGRVEDAYLSAGKIVHPGRVERVLLQHPSVAEVCVLGGDTGAIAHVVPGAAATAGVEGELLALCHERLAVHERPVAIAWAAALPRNPSGKVLRHLVRTSGSPLP